MRGPLKRLAFVSDMTGAANVTVIPPKPLSGGSWWIGLSRDQFAERARREQARMSGLTRSEAIGLIPK
jgi:hypothetical protein